MKRSSIFLNMQALTSCISMTLVLVLLGAVSFFVLTARNLSRQVRENIAITMLMSDDIKGEEVTQIQTDLQRRKFVKNISFISKEKALEEMTLEMGADPSEFLGHNPFSASFEIGLNADYANPDSIEWITNELRSIPQTMDLVYQQEWVETINKMIEKISLVLLVLAGLLTFVSFALINNTLRLSVFSKRFIIHTMTLVGASWSFIRRPFLVASMAMGFVAGVVADCMLTTGIYALLQHEPNLKDVITTSVLVFTGMSVVVFGLLISLFCAYISVNRFLNMKGLDLYTA